MVEADTGVLIACLYKYTKFRISKIGLVKLWPLKLLLTLYLDGLL